SARRHAHTCLPVPVRRCLDCRGAGAEPTGRGSGQTWSTERRELAGRLLSRWPRAPARYRGSRAPPPPGGRYTTLAGGGKTARRTPAYQLETVSCTARE